MTEIELILQEIKNTHNLSVKMNGLIVKLKKELDK